MESRMTRKGPVRFGAGEKPEITSKAYLSLLFLKHRDSADFMEEMARRARKRHCALVVVSQSFREFAESAQGRGVLANTDTVALMQQSAAELDAVAEFFRLPQGQRDFLRQAQVGQALLRAGKQAVVLQVEASPREYAIITGEEAEGEARQ